MMLRCRASLYTLFMLISSTTCETLPGFDWKYDGPFDPTKLLTDFCHHHGYPFEVHYIESYDGYILQLHRFPRKKDSDGKPAEAVLVMHGLLSSSADWIVQGPKRSLAMLLYDQGYDVWLGNSRGNTFSRNHTTLSPNDKSFWNFSWHEIGLNDAAASIDYIRNSTGQDKIFYIGYSQGTTQFWVLTSLKPEYNDRVKFMLGLAPVAFMGHTKGLTKMLTGIVYQAAEMYDKNGYFELFRSSPSLRKTSKLACQIQLNNTTTHGPLCEMFLAMGGGYSEDTDFKSIGMYFQFTPAGCSCKQLLHYGQVILHPGRFQQYDYIPEKNMRLYNSTVPPEYPLHKVTVPVGLYNTMNDWLAAPEDVVLLEKVLPNVVERYTVSAQKLNHFDFIYGLRAPTLIYDRLFLRMNEFRDTS